MALTYNSYNNFDWNTTTSNTIINTTFITDNQESDMHSSVEGSTPKITIGAVRVIGGWVGQILCDNEVIWQSKKLRNHKEDKYGNIDEGSDRAVEDARKHRIKSVRKQYTS